MSNTSGFIPYGSISLEAATEAAVGNFTDIASIQAESVRVYNSGAVEIFVGFGSSDRGGADAQIPSKNESGNSFPIAPHESEILYKGEGADQVAVVTAGGKSPVRFTAVKIQNSGDNLMGGLELVSVLKDAMGSQKLIDAAAKKIADASTISDKKKQEAIEAAKTIADAKKSLDDLENSKALYLQIIEDHNKNVSDFNTKADSIKSSIEADRIAAKKEAEGYIADIAAKDAASQLLQAESSDREALVSIKERKMASGEAELANKIAAHDIAAQKLADDIASHAEEVAKLAARKKKLDDATKED